MTILFSTHILHDAEQVCEEILMLKDGELKWNGPLQALRKEFDQLAIKLQTVEPLGSLLEELDYIEDIQYNDITTATLTLSDLSKSKVLLQEIVRQNATVVHYEMLQESLEDAYMKVMER